MSDQKQDKGQDRVKETKKGTDSSREASRDGVISSSDQQQQLKDAHGSNKDAIDISVGAYLKALSPNDTSVYTPLTVEGDTTEPKKSKAKSDAVGGAASIDAQPENTQSLARRHMDKTSARKESKVAPEALDSGIMQALANHGSEDVKAIMGPVQGIYKDLKANMPPGADLTKFVKELKQSAIDNPTVAKALEELSSASGQLEQPLQAQVPPRDGDGGPLSILQRFERISNVDVAARDANVPTWVPRLNDNYDRRGEEDSKVTLLADAKRVDRPSTLVMEARPIVETQRAEAPHKRLDTTREVHELQKPHVNGPSGTLVWKDKAGFHQAKCADGKVLDAHNKPMGDIKDDGTVVINGHSVKIASAENKGSYMFLGKDSHGEAVKLLAPQDANQLTGKLTSFDGKTSYAVVGGNIFDQTGVFKGHVDGKGHVERVKGNSGALGNDADINTLFNRHKFEGVENGHARFFVASNDMSNGTMMIPGKEIPGGKGDAMVKLQVKEGMLIDAHGKQIGVLFAPNTDSGHLDGGCVLWSGSKKPIPLCDLQNSSFDLKVLGESGHHGRDLKGLCLGPEHAGKGGLFDVQSAMDVSSATMSDKVSRLDDGAHQGLGIFKWGLDGLTGQRERDKSAEIRTDKQIHSDLDAMVKHGVTDSAKLAELMKTVARERQALEPHQAGDAKHGDAKHSVDVKPKAPPEKQVGVPPLTAQSAAQVDGSLIMDGNAFQIKHGQLYRFHDDGHGHMRADSKPSGKLLGDYKVQVDGAQVDLAHENRVLMKFTIGGDKTTHRILGMGRTRVTEGGATVEGGLVSVDDVSRKAKATAAKEVHSNEDYLKHKDVMTQLTQGTADLLMGGKADASLESSRQRYDQMTGAFDKACDKLFSTNPASGELNTKLIDHHIGTVQTVMDTFGLEIAEQQRTRGDLKQAQSTMNEAVAMSAITVATMGVGTLVSTAANAGKFATMGRFAHAASIGARVGGGAITGGTIRAVGAYHDGQSGADVAKNFGGGSLEGGIMAAANLTSSFDKAQKLSKGLGLATAVENVGGRMVPKALGEVDAILTGGGIKQTEAWLLKSGIGRAAGTLTGNEATAAKIGLTLVDNMTQTATFGVSNYYRNLGNPEVPQTGPFNATEIAIGTATGMLSHGMGNMFSRESQMFKRVNDNLPLELRFNAGDVMEQLVTQAPREAASNFTIGVCNALPTEFDRERQKIAEELGVDATSVGLKEIIEYDHLGSLMNRVAESASLNALVSLPGTLTHSLIEQRAGVHTEEYLGTPELAKTDKSLFHAQHEKLARSVVDDMRSPISRDAAIEVAKEQLGWSPSTVSKVERYNQAREQIAGLPPEMHEQLNKLLGDTNHKGVKSEERLRIVENMFKVYDVKTPDGVLELHDVATRMNECMKSTAAEQAARPEVPKLEDTFDRDKVALINAMDAAQAKLKPVEITKDMHDYLVDEGYERARSKAPGGTPAQERILHLVVGPPGAGKSSSLVNPFKERDNCIEIDSDDVKPTVGGYVAKFRGMDHVGFGAGRVHPVSSKVAHDVLMRAMDHGDNIIHPILGKSPDGVLDLVMTAKAHGYKVAIHIADVPPELSANRSFDRGQKDIDSDGKRQMVPPSYSLDAVKWGPQITFDRMCEHMQGVVDELNYCNTNVPFGTRPDIQRRSPTRIREGVEDFFERKSNREQLDSAEERQISFTHDLEGDRPIRADSVDPVESWNALSADCARARFELPARARELYEQALSNGELRFATVNSLRPLTGYEIADHRRGAHSIGGDGVHQILVARTFLREVDGEQSWVMNQNADGVFRHEVAHFLDHKMSSSDVPISQSNEFLTAWRSDIGNLDSTQRQVFRKLTESGGNREVFAELMAAKLGGSGNPRFQERLRAAFPSVWKLLPSVE